MSAGAARALLTLGILLAACSAPPPGSGPPAVRATARGDGNSAEVALSGRGVVVDIYSNRGIGAATVELTGGPAPDTVELRLHLRGLEELRLSYGEAAVVASVASGPGHAVSQRRVGADGSEEPLDPAHPAWLAIRIVAPEADPAIPLREGHIAVAVPRDALSGPEGAFSIQWVDFFR